MEDLKAGWAFDCETCNGTVFIEVYYELGGVFPNSVGECNLHGVLTDNELDALWDSDTASPDENAYAVKCPECDLITLTPPKPARSEPFGPDMERWVYLMVCSNHHQFEASLI